MDNALCGVLFIGIIAAFGITFSTGNVEVGSYYDGNCILDEVTLTCNVSEPPATLQWELNEQVVAYGCLIINPNLQDQIDVLDCASTNGVFNIRINEISQDTEGTWTCRYNSTADDEIDAMICSSPSGEDNQPNSQSSRSGAGDTTLKYEPNGCYSADPLFRWYDENWNEVTEKIETYPLSGNNCPSPQVAMGSSCTVDFPGWYQERNYTCEVSFQGRPDFVVNSKTFTVSTDQCIAECVVLPIGALVAIVVVVVVVYKKKQKRNKNTTF